MATAPPAVLDALPPSAQDHGDTHAQRNPHLPQQIPRVFNRAPLTEAQKATRSLRAASQKEKHTALVSGLDALLVKHNAEIDELAKGHSVAPDYLNKLRLQSPHFKDKRSVSITNAKIHAKAIEVNAGKLSLILFITSFRTANSIRRSTRWRTKDIERDTPAHVR